MLLRLTQANTYWSLPVKIQAQPFLLWGPLGINQQLRAWVKLAISVAAQLLPVQVPPSQAQRLLRYAPMCLPALPISRLVGELPPYLLR
jgi:hypothetical protein